MGSTKPREAARVSEQVHVEAITVPSQTWTRVEGTGLEVWSVFPQNITIVAHGDEVGIGGWRIRRVTPDPLTTITKYEQ